MRSEQEIRSILNAFQHGGKSDYYDGICYGLTIALSGRNEYGQTEQNHHKSNVWDRRPSHETPLQSNAKGAKGRG